MNHLNYQRRHQRRYKSSYQTIHSKIVDACRHALCWAMPNKCISCNVDLSETYPVCDNCYLELPFQHSSCRQCGQSFAANSDYCGKCINSPPKYDSAFCAFMYQEPLDRLIRKFKYSEHPEIAMQIAVLLKKEIENHNLQMPDLLIPVPVHINKLRERGFNQSLELVKCLSVLLDIPYANNLLVKHRATPPQAQQSLKSRHENIKNSFRCVNKINFEHVAIVDDVVTSGSTVEEITKILKQNGVNYVQVWGVTHSI